MHHEAHVDSLYGIVDAIEHGLYSSCIGGVEQIHLLHDGNLHVAEEVDKCGRMHVHVHLCVVLVLEGVKVNILESRFCELHYISVHYTICIKSKYIATVSPFCFS